MEEVRRAIAKVMAEGVGFQIVEGPTPDTFEAIAEDDGKPIAARFLEDQSQGDLFDPTRCPGAVGCI